MVYPARGWLQTPFSQGQSFSWEDFMTHLIKLSKTGGSPVHRIYEQKVATQGEIRELTANLQALVNGANRDGRELVVEIWTEYREKTYETKPERYVENSQALVGNDH